MAIAGKRDPLPPRDPQYVSSVLAVRPVPLFGGFMMGRTSQLVRGFDFSTATGWW